MNGEWTRRRKGEIKLREKARDSVLEEIYNYSRRGCKRGDAYKLSMTRHTLFRVQKQKHRRKGIEKDRKGNQAK